MNVIFAFGRYFALQLSLINRCEEEAWFSASELEDPKFTGGNCEYSVRNCLYIRSFGQTVAEIFSEV